MARIHRGATLTPHFREFLPQWVARQPWYLGQGVPKLVPVGYFRFEDPAGEVGIETHLVSDGSALYQVPMTYRGAPMPAAVPGAADALISTTEHSVLGTRWICDGAADPVWAAELIRIVRTNGRSDPSIKPGVGLAEARGQRVVAGEEFGDGAVIELNRVLAGRLPAEGLQGAGQGVLGLLTGSWYPAGADGPPASGLLAVLRR
jgi:Maltokinase N-terminal cap domain